MIQVSGELKMLLPVTLKIPANTTNETKLTSEQLRAEILQTMYIYGYNWKLRCGIRIIVDSLSRDRLLVPVESKSEKYVTGHNINLSYPVGKKIDGNGTVDIYGVNYDNQDHYVTILFVGLDSHDINNGKTVEKEYNIAVFQKVC